MAGDGGISMVFGDLMTVVAQELPIKIAVYDNGKLGFVEIEKKAEGMRDTFTKLKNPNFAGVARAIGLWGGTVSHADQLEAAVKDWLAQPGPALLHVQKCGPWLRQPVLDRGLQLVRVRNRLAPETYRARDPSKIGILQLREGIEHALRLLLNLHKAKLAVVVDGDLDRQLLCDDRHQVSEQHGNSAVACHAHDLSTGFCLLESNG